MSDLHPCARCAVTRKTCCQRAEIVVTTGDVARIAAHTNLSGFTQRTRPTDPAYLEPDPDDPNWGRYTIAADGTRRVLVRQDGVNPGASGHRGGAGDCTFLGPAGCVLPEDVRPLVCRLYPFMYTERGLDRPDSESGGLDESWCPTHLFFDAGRRALPASNLPPGTPRTTMLTVLRMDPQQAEAWRAMLYAELRADHESGGSVRDEKGGTLTPRAGGAGPTP
jgi:Fe-S-cluster containining protein